MAQTLSRRVRRAFYLLWLPLPVLLGLLLMWQGKLSSVKMWSFALISGFFYAPIAASAYYLCRANPLRYASLFRVLASLFMASLLLSGIWTVLSLGVMGFILDESWTQLAGLWQLVGVFGVLSFWLAGAYFYTMLAVQSAQYATQEALQASLIARESELKALRFQIRPHFLFNSLNAISALVTIDPRRARRMCVALADFLRATLRTSDKERHTLEEELTLLRNYLLVEQERLGPRLRLEEAVDEACLSCILPALLLQPLVENAIKHGIAKLSEGGLVRIEIQRHAENLEVHIINDMENTFGSNDEELEKGEEVEEDTCTQDLTLDDLPRQGHGLRLTQRRLRMCYGRNAQIHLKRQRTQFRITLLIPFEK